MNFRHTPVMVEEVLQCLDPQPGEIMVDGTLGGCGHAVKILEKILPGGRLIGLDQDPDAMEHARAVFDPSNPLIHLVQDNYANLPDVLAELNISRVDGILLDLGLSSHQLEQSGRGFSFQGEEPLDMRMDPQAPVTAAALVNQASESELRDLFYRLGEERFARRIARRIVEVRAARPIHTTADLVRQVMAAVPVKAAAKMNIHPATRVFMALRIKVNQELDHLDTFMRQVTEYLNPGGRICVLSFHSLEDRIVKQQMRDMARGCICPPDFPQCNCGRKPVLRLLTRKPLRPGAAEIAVNPRARSTRLRGAVKL